MALILHAQDDLPSLNEARAKAEELLNRIQDSQRSDGSPGRARGGCLSDGKRPLRRGLLHEEQEGEQKRSWRGS